MAFKKGVKPVETPAKAKSMVKPKGEAKAKPKPKASRSAKSAPLEPVKPETAADEGGASGSHQLYVQYTPEERYAAARAIKRKFGDLVEAERMQDYVNKGNENIIEIV